MGNRRDLSKLFRPESVALVGCEPVETQRVASWPLHNLLLHRSPVRAWPVTTRHRLIAGLACRPSLAELPEVPDLVLVMSGGPAVPEVLAEAESLGVGAAIVFGPVDDATRSWISGFVERSRLAVLGPNSNGICTVDGRITCTSAPFAAHPELTPGPVAVISQSGALISSLVARLRRNGLGLRLSCSIGEAIDVTIGDCLTHVADDPGTETILVYIEGLTGRDSFLAGARAAVAAGKHVVVLKAGATSVGVETVRHHTGGLVGSFAAFRALCEAEGILLAGSVDQATILPAILRSHSGAAPGVGVVAGSGGIAALLADKLTAAGLPVPTVAPETAERIHAAVGSAACRNPVDLGVHDGSRNRAAIHALAADPHVGNLVYGGQAGPDEILGPVKAALAEVAAAGTAVSVWSADGRTAIEEENLTAAGIPVEPSIDVVVDTLTAVLLRDPALVADRRDAREAWRPDRHRAETATGLIRSAVEGEAVPRDQAWQLLALYDVPGVPEYPAPTARYAGHLARYVLGYPVAMKLSHVRLAHRARAGAVELALADDMAVHAAFDRLAAVRARLGLRAAEVVVQSMVRPATELIVGARVDVEAGPVVFLGTGGTTAERTNQVAVAPAPLGPGGAARLVDAYVRVAGAVLPEAGSGRLHRIVSNLSAMAMELRDELDVIELNPVRHGCENTRAVDVLVYRSSPAGPGQRSGNRLGGVRGHDDNG
jgi:acyl-CoA synthetase (NDP forming)